MRLLPFAALAVLLPLAACGPPLAGTDPADLQSAEPEAPDGLISWWRLDSGWMDVGGRFDEVGGNHASSFVTRAVADRHGRRSRALAFDGRTSRFVVHEPQGLDIDLRDESYSLALWVRSSVGRRARLLEKWDERGGTPYPYSLQTTPTGLDAVVYDGLQVSLVHVPALWDGAWHHIAVTFDADDQRLTAYRDGDEASSRQVDILGTTQNTSPLSIGGNPAAPTRLFRGDIDEVQIYGRALTSSEVAALAAE